MRLWLKRIVLVGLALVGLWLLYEFITFPNISRLQTENPELTSLMQARVQEAADKGQEPRKYQVWVPLDKISPNLQRATLAGEDANFATHDGFDYEALQKAWDEAQRNAAQEAKENNEDPDWLPSFDFKRGASTITQQLAKNLYLTTQKSFIRKGREAVITYFLERDLSKKRILEIYLNVIEWGDGIYGAEAASRYYFNKSAAALSPQEAAFLSAIIPNPRTVFNPKVNPKRVARRQRIIARGMNYVQLPGDDK